MAYLLAEVGPEVDGPSLRRAHEFTYVNVETVSILSKEVTTLLWTWKCGDWTSPGGHLEKEERGALWHGCGLSAGRLEDFAE